MKTLLVYFFALPMLLLSAPSNAEQYLSQADFLAEALGENPRTDLVWVSTGLRESIKKHLQQNLASARIRYWELGNKRAWILDEIGRDEPITMGFVIQENKITLLRILDFRESRGYEVRYPRFTAQFSSLGLNPQQQLDNSVDNITGATLSVNAVKKAARLALYLNQQVELAAIQKP